MSRFNPFPRVNGQFGAPMGRMSTRNDFDGATDLCASTPQGEYDSGGAYWGYGGREGPIYAVWERGNGKAGVAYVRAFSKQGAIKKAMEPVE